MAELDEMNEAEAAAIRGALVGAVSLFAIVVVGAVELISDQLFTFDGGRGTDAQP